MAVEARHLNLFPSQLIQDRDLSNPTTNQMNVNSAYISQHQQQMRFLGIPTLPENQPSSFYQNQAKTTDSGLTHNITAPRKRSRDSINQIYAAPNLHATQKNNNNIGSQFSSFLGEDFFPQINQYQFEIHSLISQHTKKIRFELEEKQKQQARLMVASIGESVTKKLKEKEELIQRMGKYNLVLQERMKSLYVENQLLRDLAQSNEAAANSLRSNLEQVLAHVGNSEDHVSVGPAKVEDDVESCCGSSDDHHGAQGAQDKEEGDGYGDRSCRKCGVKEACVLLLPCRHLCLCEVCVSGSSQIQTCPVCDSSVNVTLHVNMSSS